MKRSFYSRKRKPLFNPDELATLIARHLNKDLEVETTVYDTEVFEAAKQLQRSSTLKKYRAETSASTDTASAALIKFRNNMERLESQLHLQIPSNGVIRRSVSTPSPVLRTLARARSVVHLILGEFSAEEWYDCTKHGIGSSFGVGFTDTSLEAKMTLPMTITDECIPLFRDYLKWDSTLCAYLQYHNPSVILRSCDIFQVVPGNKLTTVPKTNEIDRVIAVEPTANMFLQQGLMSVLASRLGRFGVDIETQQFHHRKMAYVASITKRFSTIDFSSASDSVTTILLRELLPPIWFEVLDKVRSKQTLIEDEWVSLPTFSTMGNATTFPLETLVFYALGVASVSVLQDTSRSCFPEWEAFEAGVTVFGDDCIIPDYATQIFCQAASLCGFEVNEEKTFSGGGKFRESCGADYYVGRNIRAYYLKAPTSSKPSVQRAWLYSVWNGLLKKTMSVFGERNYVYMSSVLSLVAKEIVRCNKEVLLVPDYYPDDSGLKTFGDWQRLCRLFQNASLSPILVNEHGTASFRFLRSVYSDVRQASDPVRLWEYLKFSRSKPGGVGVSYDIGKTIIYRHPLASQISSEPETLWVKRGKSYVVSRGLDCTAYWECLPSSRKAKGGSTRVTTEYKSSL